MVEAVVEDAVEDADVMENRAVAADWRALKQSRRESQAAA